MRRYLIATIPQIGGELRELYASSEKSAREARKLLRDDPAMIDCLDVSEIVDVSRDGTRRRIR